MCMIAYRPAGKGHIPNAVIDTAIQRHSDGFGVAYRADGMLVTEKFGPSQRKAFRKALKRIDREQGEYVAHFRWATHGPKDEHHAHPYEYTDPELGRVLVFHNGVIDIRTKPEESDTEVFVRDVLARLGGRWWANPAMRFLVNAAIDWSKLVIMTADETVNMHDGRGEWDGGLWYSSNHKPSVKSTWTSYKPTDGSVWVNGYTDKDGKYVSGHYERPANKGAVKQPTSIVPYQSQGWQGSAARSAAALGLIEANDNGSCVRVVDRPAQFRHGGHNLTAVKDISLDGGDSDYEDAVICDTCRTIGTVYVIDGQAYIDMAHLNGDPDEDSLLPGVATVRTMVAV